MCTRKKNFTSSQIYNHHKANSLLKCFRISVYFLLFGLSGEPFLELTPPSPIIGKIRMFVDSKGVYRTNGPSSLPYLPTPSPGTSGTTLTPGTTSPPGGTGASNTSSRLLRLQTDLLKDILLERSS